MEAKSGHQGFYDTTIVLNTKNNQHNTIQKYVMQVSFNTSAV